MKKILTKLLVLVLVLGFSSCKGDKDVNPVAGSWQVKSVTFDGKDVIATLNGLSEVVGMDMTEVTSCIENAKFVLSEDYTFSATTCERNMSGKYVFDKDANACTFTVNDPIAPGSELNILSSVNAEQMTFKLNDFMKTIGDLKKTIISQLEANGIEMNSILEMAIDLVISKINSTDGEAVLVRSK